MSSVALKELCQVWGNNLGGVIRVILAWALLQIYNRKPVLRTRVSKTSEPGREIPKKRYYWQDYGKCRIQCFGT